MNISPREIIIVTEAIERALKEYDYVLNTKEISGRQYSHLLCLQTELNFLLRWARGSTRTRNRSEKQIQQGF